MVIGSSQSSEKYIRVTGGYKGRQMINENIFSSV
jgi:hypothetical protein